MKSRAVAIALAAMVANIALAQDPSHERRVSLKFSIDGKRMSCETPHVSLRLEGRIIEPKVSERGFIVPAVFNRKSSEWSPDQNVDVIVSCGKYRLEFPKLHPSWVSSGSWEVGIAYPPYWTEHFGWTGATENGTWISYLDFECGGCDPGVTTTISHTTPPTSLVSNLTREQPTVRRERARDIAYALAVFNVDYQRNRDYLLGTLNSCLAKPKDSSEDDVCDARLFDYVTNLYWRGDNALLTPLLQMADSRRDVIHEIGAFYASLLERRTTAALKGMQRMPVDGQRFICALVGDDMSNDSSKLERVTKHLEAANIEVADRCLQEVERAAGK